MEILAERERKWYGNYKIPAWMVFPEVESEEEEVVEDSEVEDDGDSEEGEEDGDSEEEMNRKMCIAWILAKEEINKKLIKADRKMLLRDRETVRMEMRIRKRENRKVRMDLDMQEMCSRWKVSEMDRLVDISLVICREKLWEIELSFAMKRQLKDAQESVAQLDMKLKANNNYIEFRNMWMEIHSCWGGEFEDITNIVPMDYTDKQVPRYVCDYGLPDTLQIYSVKVVESGEDELHWPLCIFGMVAVRDCLDQNRIVIFNRPRDDCQILTKENPYLVLTGPTRSVVMKNDSIPVTIEAELKVKSQYESDDKYLILAAARVPSGEFNSLDLEGRYSKLSIEAKRMQSSVEAVVFVRAIQGKLSTGFSGYIGALSGFNTMNMIPQRSKSIVISEFGSDGPLISDNGNVYQTRFVVACELDGPLIIFCHNDDNEEISNYLIFKPIRRGRSIDTLTVGSCTLEVLVAWSLIRPVCEELVRNSQMALASESDLPFTSL